ncbi:hypothetical protein AG02_004800 [Salmonella enterica subsp. enterica]|nr:hypothetical protein [Salmonella enterica subsp. enterica serovar Poona]EJO2225679.1 hypothetical protein [Salmonella enterica]
MGNVDNPEQVQFRARKAVADAHLSGYDLQIDVPAPPRRTTVEYMTSTTHIF